MKRKPKAQCPSGKRKYYDRVTALAVAMRDTKNTGDRIVPYWCRECMWWHVGHKLNRRIK